MTKKRPAFLLWIGGVVGVVAIGLTRLASKWTGVLGMVLTIAVLTGAGLYLVLKKGIPAIQEDRHKKEPEK